MSQSLCVGKYMWNGRFAHNGDRCTYSHLDDICDSLDDPHGQILAPLLPRFPHPVAAQRRPLQSPPPVGSRARAQTPRGRTSRCVRLEVEALGHVINLSTKNRPAR